MRRVPRPPGVAPFPLQRRPGRLPGAPAQVKNRPGGMGLIAGVCNPEYLLLSESYPPSQHPNRVICGRRGQPALMSALGHKRTLMAPFDYVCFQG